MDGQGPNEKFFIWTGDFVDAQAGESLPGIHAKLYILLCPGSHFHLHIQASLT